MPAPTAPLLVELLTEELPPKTLRRLSDAFASMLTTRLLDLGFLKKGEAPCYTTYATPRRLAVLIENVYDQAAEQAIREKIMPISIALDANGQPTAALIKKLTAMGLAHLKPEDLERVDEGQQPMFFFTRQQKGLLLTPSLQQACEATLAQLPIAKKMSYQRSDKSTVQFARPAHHLVALWGSDVIPIHLLGLQAGRTTLGHRFLSKEAVITLPQASDYARLLENTGYVIASYTQRRTLIHEQLLAAAGQDQLVLSDELLDEVTGLVEFPTVYACEFEPDFLCVPQECLILTMQTHQKYIPLTNAQGQLQARFLVVSNIATETPADIIEGNERVIRPRLADARFFFEQDQKKTLAEYVPQLASVLYHHKLGSQLDRVARLENIAVDIAIRINADSTETRRAAWLAKADLNTAMVGEFPELQGVMGQYYAQHSGESAAVSIACFEHYQPRFSGDALPSPGVSTAVALADKLDTLVSMWSIGLVPTGEKDPFALRRQALGVLRIIIEQNLDLDLKPLLHVCFNQLTLAVRQQTTDPTPALLLFLLDRCRVLLRDQGYLAQEIEAVFAKIQWASLPTEDQRIDTQGYGIEGFPCADLFERLQAVHAFSALPQAPALAAANKRITNLLKKSNHAYGAVDRTLLIEPAEQALFELLSTLIPQAKIHIDTQHYTEALLIWAPLRPAVDAFFDTVRIYVEDERLCNNRLALLTVLHRSMNEVAELSKLAQ